MAIFGRKRPSMGRVRQQAAPVPVPPPAPAKPAGRAFGNAGKGFGSVSKAPVAVAAPAAQAAGLKQFQGQQAAFNAANMADISRTSTTPSTPQQNIAIMQAAKAAVAQQRPNPNISIPMETMRAAPAQAQRTGSAPAVSQQKIAKDIIAQNAVKGNNMMLQASMDAQQRFNEKQAQKAKATPAPVAQVPSPPPFRKGGAVKKKTGYAKGGAVMCGASMPPAQKRKK